MRVVFDPDLFVIAWESADSLDELAGTLDVTKNKASSFAARLRKKGVDLKYFANSKKRIDADALNRRIMAIRRKQKR